jgi:flagellin-like hook-associated protein FlgL
VDKIENADTTQAITELQQVQTQLQASYQVTRITSELSLVNFIR